MSEESKTAEGDYVMMGSGVVNPKVNVNLNIDDPSLSQEEKDHRLAIAMQQQENAAAYGEHKKKHEEIEHAKHNRTGRSGTYTKLAAVRGKDHGTLKVPAEYNSEHAYKPEDGNYMAPTGFTPPKAGAAAQEVADHQLATELQKVEQLDAGTVRTMQKMVTEEEQEEESHKLRTTLSKYTL